MRSFINTLFKCDLKQNFYLQSRLKLPSNICLNLFRAFSRQIKQIVSLLKRLPFSIRMKLLSTMCLDSKIHDENFILQSHKRLSIKSGHIFNENNQVLLPFNSLLLPSQNKLFNIFFQHFLSFSLIVKSDVIVNIGNTLIVWRFF